MTEVLIIVVCLILNALLSGSEMALVTVAKSRLRELAKTGNMAARKALTLRDNPERTLSVIQLGITLVGAIAAAVGGAGAEESISPILRTRFHLSENWAEFFSILIVVLPITYFSVIFGELVPKSVALKNPLKVSLRSSRWLLAFDRLLSPMVTLLEKSTKKFLSLFNQLSTTETSSTVVNTLELDLLSQLTRQYVVNLVSIEKKRVGDIYLPLENTLCIDKDQNPKEVEKTIISSGHTRIPVRQGNEMIGLLNTKEFFAHQTSPLHQSWQSLIRPIVRIDEKAPLVKALRTMQERRSHLSLVYRNHQLLGIVTMEDIFEEVIGDIYDEDDFPNYERSV